MTQAPAMHSRAQAVHLPTRATSSYGLIARDDQIGVSLYAVKTFVSGQVVLAFRSVSLRAERDRYTWNTRAARISIIPTWPTLRTAVIPTASWMYSPAV